MSELVIVEKDLSCLIMQQKKGIIYFKGEPIGEFFIDNIANGRVILEYKAVSEIARIHKQKEGKTSATFSESAQRASRE